MRLVSLHLRNFRQYYGEQSLRFAQEPNRNVTIINGANGAGKTGLFSALIWVLYGSTALSNIGELINKRALTEAKVGERVVASVELTFVDSGQKHLAVRTLSRQRLSAEDWTEPKEDFSVSRIKPSGEAVHLGNPTGAIEAILPSPVRSYFFFDGEKIDQFAQVGHEEEVERAVRDVLKLEVLERAKRHLDSVAREYQKELAKVTTGRLQGLVEEEQAKRNELDGVQAELQSKNDELRRARRHLADIDQRLADVREAKRLIDRRTSLEAKFNELDEKYNQVLGEINDLVTTGYLFLAGPVLQQAISILDEKRSRGEIPSGIREQFILDLLSELRCICGRPIEEGGAEYQRLESLLQNSVPSDLENIVLDTAAQSKAMLQMLPSLPTKLAQLLKDRSKLEQQMEEVHNNLDEVSRQLKTSEVEEISDLEHKRSNYLETIASLSHHIGRLEGREEELLAILKDYADKIAKEQTKEDRSAKLQLRATLARRAADAVSATLDVFAEQVRVSIQTKAKEIFQKLIWKDSQFQEIRVGPDYKLDVIDRWGMPARPELSAGERQVLSLAFITGMAKEAGEEAPLVMDTPFGRLSRAHRESITRNLPELAPQVVLFVQDEELRDKARENLADYVGEEYILEFDEATGCTTINPA